MKPLGSMTVRSFKKGFTLIELLVVISIIALLSSVVLATVKTAKDKAAIAKTQREIAAFKTAMELYRNTNSDYYNNGFFSRSGVAGEYSALTSAMAPYIKVGSTGFLNPSTNFHYAHGTPALLYGVHVLCGGRQVQPNGYIAFFYDPLIAGQLPIEPSSNYSCFLND